MLQWHSAALALLNQVEQNFCSQADVHILRDTGEKGIQARMEDLQHHAAISPFVCATSLNATAPLLCMRCAVAALPSQRSKGCD